MQGTEVQSPQFFDVQAILAKIPRAVYILLNYIWFIKTLSVANFTGHILITENWNAEKVIPL